MTEGRKNKLDLGSLRVDSQYIFFFLLQFKGLGAPQLNPVMEASLKFFNQILKRLYIFLETSCCGEGNQTC